MNSIFVSVGTTVLTVYVMTVVLHSYTVHKDPYFLQLWRMVIILYRSMSLQQTGTIKRNAQLEATAHQE